jgi:hypothetical protein
MASDDVAELLHKEATRQARKVQEEAEATAQLDMKRDEEEERETSEQGPMKVDRTNKMPTGDEKLGASSVHDFENMIREASKKGILLSESVVKQEFGILEMEDENEYKQGMAGKVDGKLEQSFGNVKIGSKNKVQQGVYE